MSATREQVIAAVRAAFPRSDAGAILSTLDLYGAGSHERDKDRVQLAIVELSGGDEEKLLSLVQAAKTDYRDVLMWQSTGPLSEEEGARLKAEARELIERWGKK